MCQGIYFVLKVCVLIVKLRSLEDLSLFLTHTHTYTHTHTHARTHTHTHTQGGLAGKSTASQLRVAYLHCILELCQGENKTLVSLFQPLLGQSLDRVSSSSSPQPAALEEALVACHVLIKINYPGGIPSQVWSIVSTHSEQLVSSKLISSASQESEFTEKYCSACCNGTLCHCFSTRYGEKYDSIPLH